MEIVFTFSGTHQAIEGERTLLEGGLKVRVMALPSGLGAGCGLCLRVGREDLAAAQGLLANAATEPEGVYLKSIEEGKTVYRPVKNS